MSQASPAGRARRPSRPLRPCLVLLLAIPMSGAFARTTASCDSSTEQLEEIALWYAEESYRDLRVPLVLRIAYNDWTTKKEEIEKLRADPPRIDDIGHVHPFGPSNGISLSIDEGTGEMVLWHRFIKLRGKTMHYGLTGAELAAGLNQATTRKKRGGGDWAWNQERDALSLRRGFCELPEDREQLYREFERLLDFRRKLDNNERFIRQATAIRDERLPPASATAIVDGFEGTLGLRHFSAAPGEGPVFADRFRGRWDRKWGGPAPTLTTDRVLTTDQTMYAYVFFQGMEGGPDGHTRVEATLRILRPDESIVAESRPILMLGGESPPVDHIQIGWNNLSFAFDENEPAGHYLVWARICESTKGRCVEVEHPFELRHSR